MIYYFQWHLELVYILLESISKFYCYVLFNLQIHHCTRYLTFQKYKVFGQLNPLEKCLKICYIYGKRKSMQFFSFFIQSNFHFSLLNALVWAFIFLDKRLLHKSDFDYASYFFLEIEMCQFSLKDVSFHFELCKYILNLLAMLLIFQNVCIQLNVGT